jgi:deoxyribonuclease-4
MSSSNSNQTKREIGGHVSISGGLDKAIHRAVKIGGNCMQVFSGSPRSWKRSLPEEKGLKKMFALKQEIGFKSIFTHTLYLINLASDKPELVDKSVRSLISDLKFDSLVKGSGAIVHIGSHQGRGWDAAKQQLKELLLKILDKIPEDSTLLIENSAGQKGKIGSNLEEIRWLIDELKDKRVGWCVDTCHAFAAGFPLVKTSKLCQQTSKSDLVSTMKDLDLIKDLKCIHFNDSKAEFDSGNDRHENIGDGVIPQQDLENFAQEPVLQHIPLITEVPGLDGKGPDKANIERIKKLAQG